MDLDYYKCSISGVYADDGALRNKNFIAWIVLTNQQIQFTQKSIFKA